MPAIDLSILNQRQTPAFYADVLANRPAAGFIGRIFVSTNTFAFYRDNGTGWDLIGGPGTGTVTGSGTTGQVTFWDGASTITGDSGLTYNGTTNALTSLGTITSTNYYVGTPSDLTRSFAARGNANTVALWLEEYGATTASPDVFMFKGQGSSAAPSNVLVGDGTGAISTGGYVNGFLNASLSLASVVVNIDSTNNQANSDLIISQTYNSVTAVENFRVRSSDGYVVAPNGGFETTGNINLFAGANTRRIVFDANNGIPRIFSFRTGNLPRWAFRVDGTETGTDTGADLAIRRYNDAGTFVDAPLSINRASGQSTFAKKVVIENNVSDQQLQIVSTTAPSLRIDNVQTGATKRAGLGLATAVNNFIQGSADRDYCIFNSSTTASPILFGVYDAGLTNTQEAARISAARNFLIGTTTDSGQKLQVNGTTRITGVATFNSNIVTNSYLQIVNASNPSLYINNTICQWQQYVKSNNNIAINDAVNDVLTLGYNGSASYFQGCNLLIGTTTDNGNKLQVNGNGWFTGGLKIGNANAASGNLAVRGTGTTSATYSFEAADANGVSIFVVRDDKLTQVYEGNFEVRTGTIKTAAPSGGTAQTWKLGNYTAGAAVQSGKVRVEINGVAYDLLTA